MTVKQLKLCSARHITPRMMDIVELIMAGECPKNIARRLKLSPHTVRQYIHDTHERFGVQSTVELVLTLCGEIDERN